MRIQNMRLRLFLKSIKIWIIICYGVISIVANFIQIGFVDVSNMLFIVLSIASIALFIIILLIHCLIKEDDLEDIKYKIKEGIIKDDAVSEIIEAIDETRTTSRREPITEYTENIYLQPIEVITQIN